VWYSRGCSSPLPITRAVTKGPFLSFTIQNQFDSMEPGSFVECKLLLFLKCFRSRTEEGHEVKRAFRHSRQEVECFPSSVRSHCMKMKSVFKGRAHTYAYGSIEIPDRERTLDLCLTVVYTPPLDAETNAAFQYLKRH